VEHCNRNLADFTFVFSLSMRTKTVVLGMLWFFVAGQVFGQPPVTQLKFEVASVKPSAPERQGMFSRYLPGGGLRITGATLQNLISMAYDVQTFQLSGGPKWTDTERFDIDARLTTSDATDPTNPGLTREDQWKAAEGLRSLLADRFQLTLHPETREQPVFVLVEAKGGHKLQESTESGSFIRRMGRGSIKGQAVALRLLVLNLASELGRPVIDKTGLTGKYSFEFKWDPSPPSAVQPSVVPDPDGTSIFTALQEQLGLRLESRKGPVKVLVVDHAERPLGN
jgi:bla regulator protein blaR1